ncbi:hypothetical protein Tco_0246243, partial [Tanacetum coccineum]
MTVKGRTRRKEERMLEHPNVGWFTKKSRSTNATKRRTTWFGPLLKLDIDQNENYILGPSTVAIAKKLKELIQKDELTIADLEAQWNSGKGDVSKLRSFARHMSKSSKPHPTFYNNNFYYLVSLNTGEKYATSLTKHYATRYHIQGIEDIILERWSKEYEFEKYFNNALLLFIRRTVLQNRVEELQLGVESYQRTLNLTKPKLYFEGIIDKIPNKMYETEKGVVYLNQHNHRSLMKLNEVKKFYDGTLMKIQESLIDMVNKNELGRVMKRREQLRRFEEYVSGRPKTIDPHFYVRPMQPPLRRRLSE